MTTVEKSSKPETSIESDEPIESAVPSADDEATTDGAVPEPADSEAADSENTDSEAADDNETADGEATDAVAEGRGSRLRSAASAVAFWPERLGARTRKLVVGLLAVLVIAGSGGLGYLWVTVDAGKADAAAGSAALAAARTDVPKLLGYDYRTIDTTFPAIANSALTGKFADQYRELGSSVIIPAAKKDNIVTTAEVVAGSVVSARKDAVTVLLFVNQSTTSSTLQGPRLDGSRVRVELQHTDGGWKVSELTPV